MYNMYNSIIFYAKSKFMRGNLLREWILALDELRCLQLEFHRTEVMAD